MHALRHNQFAFIDVCEVLLRYYKPEPERFRPVDRMVAHTGFLIFARPILAQAGKLDEKLVAEIGLVLEIDEENRESDPEE